MYARVPDVIARLTFEFGFLGIPQFCLLNSKKQNDVVWPLGSLLKPWEVTGSLSILAKSVTFSPIAFKPNTATVSPMLFFHHCFEWGRWNLKLCRGEPVICSCLVQVLRNTTVHFLIFFLFSGRCKVTFFKTALKNSETGSGLLATIRRFSRRLA